MKHEDPKITQHEDGTFFIEQSKYIDAWEIHDAVPLDPAIDDWFQVRVAISGTALSLFVDDRLVFEQREFLRIPAGKIGFRNSGQEKALLKDIRVALHPGG